MSTWSNVVARLRLRAVLVSMLMAAVAVWMLRGSVAWAQPPNRLDVLVGFRNTPGPAEQALVRARGGSVTRTFHLVPAIAADVPEPALAGLLADPSVTAVELDGTVSALDPELDSAWGVQRIDAGTVHISGNRGFGVKVAIIDSGIDYTHADLDANYVGGWDFVNDDSDPMDDNSHGTHVAGTVAAEGNGGGVIGVAPQASLYALKVLNASGSGSWSDVIAALQWAVDNDLHVTNNSYGSGSSPGSIVESAFINAAAAGLVHVASAGNAGDCSGTGNTVGYPARYASVLAVGATNASDGRPCFSSTGPDVELAAPGVSITSTLPGGAYGEGSGTSMAAPHVAGTAALLIAAGLTDANSVRATLTATAVDLGAPGRDSSYGFGLVDASAVVAAVASSPPSAPRGLRVVR